MPRQQQGDELQGRVKPLVSCLVFVREDVQKVLRHGSRARRRNGIERSTTAAPRPSTVGQSPGTAQELVSECSTVVDLQSDK